MDKIVLDIQVTYDEEASVWVASSDDVPGLATEAPSFKALMDRVEDTVPELMALNNMHMDQSVIPLAFHQNHYRSVSMQA